MHWKEIVQDYICKHSNLIQKTTKPLKDCLGIEYFTYHKIDRDGNYSVLVDRPEFAEHYVAQEIYKSDPFLRNYENYGSGVTLMDHHGSDEYKDLVLSTGKAVMDVTSCLVLIKKEREFVEFFGFGSKYDKSYFETFYLNHQEAFKAFSSYFKKETSHLLQEMHESESSLVKLKGHDFYTEEKIYPKEITENLLTFYEDLGMANDIDRLKTLSLQEINCLKAISKAMTAKQTAKHLKISHRTVESYIENIKNKLLVLDKKKLFILATRFDSIGLLQ